MEYKQINLGNVDRHVEVFTPPKEWNGAALEERFDVVYDLSGEIGFDKPELVGSLLSTLLYQIFALGQLKEWELSLPGV